MIIPVPGAGQHGLIVDLPHSELPLNAWTAAQNIRFRDGAAEKILGHAQVFGEPLWAPRWLLPITFGGSAYWIYASETKVGATNGTNHADITRQTGGDYTMSQTAGWTGTVIEEIPVINNGLDVPQMWKFPALNQRLTPLPGWPADTTANTMRGIKRFLVALDVSKAGQRFPNMIKWSAEAPTGNVPQSWDFTDETIDAGEWTLPGKGGYLVDAKRLRDELILYKEQETWQMQYVGGIDVFRFSRKFSGVGCLSRRCAVEFFRGQHLVFTGEDVVVHDGQTPRSILNSRIRDLLRKTMDQVNYANSFVAMNYSTFEVFVCYPEAGHELPNKALVWNWHADTWGTRDLPSVAFIESGLIPAPAIGATWDTANRTWEEATIPWGDRASDPTKQNMLMAVPDEVKLYIAEMTYQAAGVNMPAYVERTGLGIPLKANQPPDYETMKQVLSVWPRISGTVGGVVNVCLGIQQLIDGPITWYDPQPFRIGETEFCDFADSEASRIHAIKFSSNSDITWRLHGFDLDVISRGAR